MKKNKDDTSAQKLKKAKRAVWKAYWLNSELPEEYHCMAVRQECCTMHFLKFYISRKRLCNQAELLLVEKHLASHPDLILSYVKKHAGNFQMLVEILQNASRDFIVKLIKQEHSCTPPRLSFSPMAQKTLVNRGDNRLFEYFLLRRSNILSETITEIIKQQKTDMLRLIFKHAKSSSKPPTLTRAQEEMLIETNNLEMIKCYAHYRTFGLSALKKLIERKNIPVLEIIQNQHPLPDDGQKILARYGSKNLIACYLQTHSMNAEAQIELIKRDYKDLLKLHYLKHGIADKAMLYHLSLKSFKAYIGV